MAIRYSVEVLIHLRSSPLCTKPTNLPSAEEWMGTPVENSRASNNKTNTDRRTHDTSLLDSTNRRPGLDSRHVSRNSANPEDIILGPPRTAFASATLRNNGSNSHPSTKAYDAEKGAKDQEPRNRFAFGASRNGETEGADRFQNSRTNAFRRRADADQDTDGWSTVKPRKSFGHEGAERFHGRMGGGDRFANDRKPRERDERDPPRDRDRRAFDTFSRDKDGDEMETQTQARPRNGLNRGKSEPWFKADEEAPPPLTARERIDRAKSWRERDKDTETSDQRSSGRQYERRWDRDRDQGHRVEKEPEWFDEPAEEKAGGHTEEDFKKFMETMKASRTVASSEEKPANLTAGEAAIEAAKPAVASAPALEPGPDKFFLAFASTSGLDTSAAASPDAKKETSSKAKPAAKSSRFTSFFNAPQEDATRRLQTEPPTPLAAPPPPNGTGASPPPDPGEKEAFQALLMKLQRQSFNTNPTPPAPQPYQQPPPSAPPQDAGPKNAVASPEQFQLYGGDRRDDPRMRQQQPPLHEILAPRPMIPTQPPQVRQDQLLQDLVGQRHHAPSQGSSRMDSNPGRNTSNTEFLMNLMRAAPEPQRADQLLMRMPQPQRTAQIPHPQEREPDFPGNVRGPQRQIRSQPPPGFMDEPAYHPEQDHGPQPTQILRRPPPPPGLDQMNPNWMPGGGGPMPPQRTMIPPPGLPGGPNRNMPMPGMFPPNFPPGGFPPDGMVGPPPRNMQPPPGFFGGPPPPGFIPPSGMGGFQGPPGPDGHGFGSPFDGRGMPPPGAAQAFRRP